MVENYYKGIKEVMILTEENFSQCETCRDLTATLADAVNHYLSSEHGYKLLHVGTQSSLHGTGDVVHDIAFVLGQ